MIRQIIYQSQGKEQRLEIPMPEEYIPYEITNIDLDAKFNQLSQAIAVTTSFSLELKVRRVGELWASRWQWQAKYKSYKQDLRCPQAGFETVGEALEDFIQQSQLLISSQSQ